MNNKSEQDKMDEFLSGKQIKWPAQGDKVTFRGVKKFWYWSVVKAAQQLLEVGKVYTVEKCEPFSSWVSVELKEFPEQRFTLSFFDMNNEDVEKKKPYFCKITNAPADLDYERTSWSGDMLDVCEYCRASPWDRKFEETHEKLI